jgi:tight adherence protein C
MAAKTNSRSLLLTPLEKLGALAKALLPARVQRFLDSAVANYLEKQRTRNSLDKRTLVAYSVHIYLWLGYFCAGLGSGLNTLAAFQMSIRFIPKGGLRNELEEVLRHVYFGKSFGSALKEACVKCKIVPLRNILSDLSTSDQLGNKLSEQLARKRGNIFEELNSNIQEKASEAPVKLIFPLAVFVLPAILLVLCAPMVADLFKLINN